MQCCYVTQGGTLFTERLLLQDAGLQALVAAANVLPVPLALPTQDYSRLHNPVTVTKTALPVESGLQEGHQSASVSCVESILAPTDEGAQEPAWVLPGRTAQEGVKSASDTVMPLAEAIPGRCSQPHVARKRKHKRRDASSGITPEHMLYWVTQADIAAQLRCTDEASPEAGLMPEAASTEAPSQEACSSMLPASSLPDLCAGECILGCQQQGSRTGQETSDASKVCYNVEPVLQKSPKRRQCL